MAAACTHARSLATTLFPAADYMTGDQFVVAQCAGCGFMVTLPVLVPDEMGRYYPRTYYGSPKGARFTGVVEWLQDALYGWRAGRVEALAANRGRVLDIGCGRGLLLKQFRARAWDVQGTELTDTAATFAREVLGIPVQVGTMERLEFPDATFDAVVMWHVLEHVSDPRPALVEAARVLRPGGVLMVAVPNAGGLEARICRDKWFHLDVPRHQSHLTWSTLRDALHGAGLSERSASGLAPEYDAFSFTQSVMNRVGMRHNLLYNLMRVRDAKVLRADGAGPVMRLLAFALAVPLVILSLPITGLLGLARNGGTMTIWAVKR